MRSPPLPYGPGAPIGQYNGSGDPSTLLASYNKTMGTKTETNDSDDFTITVAQNWDTTSNLSFTEITARRVVLDVETNESADEGGHTIHAAMSFHVTNSCRLHSVMVKVKATVGSLVNTTDDLSIRIYNATNDGSGRPKPHRAATLPGDYRYFDLGEDYQTFDDWLNATWSSTIFLNASKTYQSYFFVVLWPESGASPTWQLRSDAATGDRGYAWRTYPAWVFSSVDYFLNVSLRPMGSTPAPTQVAMKVNGTAVANATGNAGRWNGAFTPPSGSAVFDVSATWPITFNYTYVAGFTRLLSTASYFVAIRSLSTAGWNLTAVVSYPNVGANLYSRTLDFTIPPYWNVALLYRGFTLIPSSNYTWPGASATVSHLLIDEPHGAGNGTWRVVCTDRNYVNQVFISRNGLNVNGLEVNITDALRVSASLQVYYTDGNGHLDVYDRDNASLFDWTTTPVSYWLNFSQFSPNASTPKNGRLTCEVVWGDGWHVGAHTAYVWLVYKTAAVPQYAVQTAYVGDVVTLRVFYNDTLNNQPIPGAQVNVTIDGVIHSMTDQGGGWYQYGWNSTGETNADYSARYAAKKVGYSQAVASSTVSLQFRTQISGAAPASVEGGAAFNVSITYEILGGGGINGASFTCLLDGAPFTGFIRYELGGGQYRLRFVLNVSQNPATYNITLTASHAGYVSATFKALVQVTIKTTTYSVIVTSVTPIVYNGQFVLRVNFTDGVGTRLTGALVTGNWSGIAQTDHLNGTYTVRCPTTSATAGYWYVNFSISLQNYETQWFVKSFELVWPTTLTPMGGSYTVREYENETLVLQVTYTDTHAGAGISTGTLWAVFRGSSYGLVSLGGGVYRLTLNLTGVPPADYTLDLSAQGQHYQQQGLQLTLQVLAKLAPNLSVILPSLLVEGTEIPVTIELTFPNGTPIVGAKVSLRVWVHQVNGTDIVLTSQNVTTNLQGRAIVAVPLPSYSQDFWTQGQPPEVRVLATYGGSRAMTVASTQTSRTISQASPLNPLLALLLRLLPFIIVIIVVILIGWAYYAKSVKPRRAKRLKVMESGGGAWAQRMLGLLDLRALFVMHASSGLPIFTYSFTGGELPSTLLSGFISAVSAFHGELSGQPDRASQLRDIHYKDLHLSLHEGRRIISVAILEASPSEEVTQSLTEFTRRFEQTYAPDLARFDGRIDIFEGADELVGKSFHSDLLVAHKCDKKPARGFPRRVYALAKKLARTDGHVYLPQLFVAAVEQFGADKKYAIAHAIETLRNDGCLAPSTPPPASAPSSRPEDPPAQG